MIGGDAGGPGGWMGGMFGYADERQVLDYVEGRLAFVKAELDVTPQQMPLWDKFADPVRSDAKSVNERIQPFFSQEWQTKSLPDRLDQQEKVLAARLDALRQTSAAIKPLYAALGAGQKKVADLLLGQPMGGFRGLM